MIKISTVREQYVGTDEFAPGLKITVRVYNGDDLPSLPVAEVMGYDLSEKLTRAVSIVKAMGLDMRWVVQSSERRHTLTPLAEAVSGLGRDTLSGQGIATVGGEAFALGSRNHRIAVDEGICEVVNRLMARLGANQEPFADGTIGTPLAPRI